MWIDEFTQTVSHYYDTPSLLVEALGYWAVGASLKDRVWIDKASPLYPNMYLVIVSPPGWYRKSSVAKFSLKVVRRIVGDEAVLPNYASAEAFMQCINGVPYGILWYDEFKGFTSHVRKEYAAGIMPFVTEMFDSTDLLYKHARSGKDPIEIKADCILSFISTSTDAWLVNSMRTEDALSGFLSRFLIVESDRKEKELIHQPPMNPAIIDDLADKLTQICTNVQGPMRLSSAANNVFEKAYMTINDARHTATHPDFPSMVVRAPVYIHKTAMIRAVCHGRMEISEEDIYEATQQLVLPGVRSIMRLFNEGAFDDKFQKDVIRLKKFLSKNNNRMSQRALMRKMHLKKRDFEEILQTLQHQGEIYIEKDGKALVVFLVDEQD